MSSRVIIIGDHCFVAQKILAVQMKRSVGRSYLIRVRYDAPYAIPAMGYNGNVFLSPTMDFEFLYLREDAKTLNTHIKNILRRNPFCSLDENLSHFLNNNKE